MHHAVGGPSAVELTAGDFASGSLDRVSYARPSKLFTANESLVVRQVVPSAPRSSLESRRA
jgi:hypothetical protein